MAIAETSRRSSSSGMLENCVFGILAYLPFLLSPGRLTSDTKQYLYLDPGRFLARAPYLWDRQVGAGTASHQHIGYLFPMGPFFWLAESLGLSDQIAQRLWLGTISLLAGLGALWLFKRLGLSRAGAIAGAIIYMLTPYQLAFTARMSVLLLPWAALGWIVGLVMQGAQERSWRFPAALALIVMSIGSVNVSALIFVAVAPMIWVAAQAFRRSDRRVVWSFVWRSALLIVGASAWWLNGLRLQGTYGLPILQLTENVKTVSEFSDVADVLRGLGNWFFYGTEPDGSYSVVQAGGYMSNRLVILASFAVPTLAIMTALVIKWRYRAYFVSLIVVGTVVGVGAHPYSEPSIVGRLWRSVAESWSLATALRNTPRVGPIIVLGCAGLIAAGVAAFAGRNTRTRLEWGAAIVVVAIVGTAFVPVLQHGYFSGGFDRPEEIPAYWEELAESLQATDALRAHTTRVLEIPGSNFTVFRWGNTIEPLTPGLSDVGYLAREVLPYGTEGTVNLLDAFDRRMQLGTFEPASLAPIARLFAVGTIVVRNDLVYEHGGSAQPRLLWASLTQPLAEGTERQQIFGALLDDEPVETILNPIGLRLARSQEADTTAAIPRLARFDLEATNSIVAVAPVARPVLLIGDGDGIVDAAAAGIIDGQSLVLELGALSDAQLSDSLSNHADIVLTDTNRLRYRNFFSSIARTSGPTEQLGLPFEDPNGYSHRPDLFAYDSDDSRSVLIQSGGTTSATRDGGSGRPEATAAKAFDGDVRTAWRVDGAEVVGSRIVVEPESTEMLDSFTVVQALNWPRDRSITQISYSVNGAEPVTVDVGTRSFNASGQKIRIKKQEISSLEIEVLATTTPPIEPRFANAVGFAEIRLGSVRIEETVRLPVALDRRPSGSLSDHRLDIVLSRLRSDPGIFNSGDEELEINRVFEISEPRDFTFTATARVNPNASDEVLDTSLGTYSGVMTVSSSSHLQGDLDSRASRAFDGSVDTAWTTEFGPQPGQWIQADFETPQRLSRVWVDVMVDGRHQVPASLAIEVDGVRVATQEVADLALGQGGSPRGSVLIEFDAVTGSRVRVIATGVAPASLSPNGYLPLGFAEVEIENVGNVLGANNLSVACRDDLLFVDGHPLSVRLIGNVGQLRSGLSVEPCDGALRLGAGSHRVKTARGLDVGIDVDRIVLSAPGSGDSISSGMPRGARFSEAGASIAVVNDARDRMALSASTDGEPFWLLVNESMSAGWRPTSNEAEFGPLTMVNGYANGWLVVPKDKGTIAIDLAWEPQDSVWIALTLSGLVVMACIAILLVSRRRRCRETRRSTAGLFQANNPKFVDISLAYRSTGSSFLQRFVPPIATGLAIAVVSSPAIGILLAFIVVAVSRLRVARVAVFFAVPALVIGGRVLDHPAWVWFALGLLLADVMLSVETNPIATTEDLNA